MSALIGGGKTPEVREAKRLFLHGGPDGVRIINAEKLAEAAGCHAVTVRKHLPAWEKEYEDICCNRSENALSLRLNAETLAKHKQDVDYLRVTLDSLKKESEKLPQLVAVLGDTVQKFLAVGDKDSAEIAAAAFAQYLRLHGNRSALNTQILAIQKRWTECAGIDSLQTVAETREKTLATGRAKLQLRAEDGDAGKAGDGGSGATPASGRGGVFAKRGGVVDVVEDIDLGEL